MNEHLKPVFEFFLPALEGAGIDYWVYGGVSIAAYANGFIRRNKDVDVFVVDNDFNKAKSVLEYLCNKQGFKLKPHDSNDPRSRPKIDIIIDSEERMSVIPVYRKNDLIVFRYRKGGKKYPDHILERIERNISGYKFFTPSNEFIREMFINHMEAEPKKKERCKFKKDAKAILDYDDLAMMGWNIDC